ncbi:flagellar motor switch protein FliN [Candidatus Poribacteria bacterium]|nr:flagellar motor switch protein FliN [Candidatus Poribacteria bacterium]
MEEKDVTQEELDALLEEAMKEADEIDIPGENNPDTGEEAKDKSQSKAQLKAEQNDFQQGVKPEKKPIQNDGFENMTSEPDREKSNIDILMDVPLDVSVELGRTRIAIKDMLKLGPGSVVELDKLIGEPVDLLVNGRLIARGEVVVFDENFGIRITDIINPADRIKSLR